VSPPLIVAHNLIHPVCNEFIIMNDKWRRMEEGKRRGRDREKVYIGMYI
jgi:hypothetical protein